MIVYWVAAAEILLYMSAVPLHLALLLRIGDGLEWGVGFAAFDARAAEKNARENLRGPGRAARDSGPRLPAAVLRHIRAEWVGVSGSVAMGDAAATAMACGALEALRSALRARADRVSVRVAPDFGGGEVRVRLSGMIRLRAGQIIRAAAGRGLQQLYGRIAPWKSAPLKAS